MTTGHQVSDDHSLGEDLVLPEDAATELEMDTMHILPLGVLPIRTPALKRARLVKNIKLESMIELFGGDSTGSGQIAPNALGTAFDWPKEHGNKDERLVRSLAKLPSFDVYSLRVQLRKHGINTDSSEALKLSGAKAEELTLYMTVFTKPLLEHVYGNSDRQIDSVGALIGMFSAPDKQEALKNLQHIAARLGIGLRDVPKFLEEFGDVYMSLAYYRDCLDTIIPQILAFEESMADIKKNQQLRNYRRLMHCIEIICEVVSNLTQSVLNRFTEFDQNSAAMWEDLSAVSFNRIKESIQRDHVAIGGILCGLTVKMSGWENKFKPGSGVVRRAEFIMSDMVQGLDLIGRIDENDPDKSGISEMLLKTPAAS